MGLALPGPRPQPLGVMPWPAGMLLLPDVPGADELAASLRTGAVPSSWPEGCQFYRAALDGDPQAAADLVPGDGPIARYDRAVLVGGPGAWEELAESTDGALHALVQTARYSIGQVDSPPELPAQEDSSGPDGSLPGEVAAMVHSARASAALEARSLERAVQELALGVSAATAAPSPVLAASLRLALAELLRDAGDPAASAREADAALRALPVSAEGTLRAQLQVIRGLSRQDLAGQDRGALLAVVSDLTEASRVLREDTHPELFATCQQHLALAYLVMPMSDQGDRIRQGVAVTALRAALRVFTPDTHPAAWASTQLNLANALQYLPSVHQEQNLDEAVQLYEELLAHRDPRSDPLGCARILSNQGNALGHLGVFADARDRLHRARELFSQAGDLQSAATVTELLAGVEAAAADAGAGRR